MLFALGCYSYIVPNLIVVLTGQFIKNIGGLPCAYVFMALFADTLDHIERKSGIRCDGTAMSIYNIIAVASVGICTGIFNFMLAQAGYIAPSIDAAGNTVAAAQPDSVINVITFAFVGLEVITGIALALILIFLNVEKTVTRKQEMILEYRKQDCLAAGKEWIDPETAAALEQERQERESVENYLAELKIKCAKNGWDYEQKAEEYRRKTAEAKQKAQRAEAKRAAKLSSMTAEKRAALEAREAKKAAAIDRLWGKEKSYGAAYRAKIKAQLAKKAVVKWKQ